MMLALLLLASDWFRAFQYTPKSASLKGCAECAGEPDDLCEVRAGAQAQALDDYARGRFPAPGRIKLLRSRADPDCAVQEAQLYKSVELAAIRLASTPPSAAILDKAGAGIRGWPRHKKPGAAVPGKPQRAAVRSAILCWPAEQGWPSGALGRANACEAWLLAVKPGSGEADLDGVSFPLEPRPVAFGDARWARAFDPAASLDEPEQAAREPESRAAPSAQAPAGRGPANTQAPSGRGAAGGQAAAEGGGPAPARCGEAARARAATLDRFDQWDRQVRKADAASLDRAALRLDAAAWAGHCQELDVLRAALEQQLGCALEQQGSCPR